LSNAQDESMKY